MLLELVSFTDGTAKAILSVGHFCNVNLILTLSNSRDYSLLCILCTWSRDPKCWSYFQGVFQPLKIKNLRFLSLNYSLHWSFWQGFLAFHWHLSSFKLLSPWSSNCGSRGSLDTLKLLFNPSSGGKSLEMRTFQLSWNWYKFIQLCRTIKKTKLPRFSYELDQNLAQVTDHFSRLFYRR